MTVLQQSAPPGSSGRGWKKTLAGLAIVVAGVGAGFGLGQRVDEGAVTQDVMSLRAPTTTQDVETWRHTGIAQFEEMRAHQLVRQHIATGLVQQAAIDVVAGVNRAGR